MLSWESLRLGNIANLPGKKIPFSIKLHVFSKKMNLNITIHDWIQELEFGPFNALCFSMNIYPFFILLYWSEKWRKLNQPTWSYSEEPGYRGQPRKSSAMTQPSDHISIASQKWRPSKISGALPNIYFQKLNLHLCHTNHGVED